MRFFLALVAFFLLLPGRLRATPEPEKAANEIKWQPWSESVFSQAKREHKFVLLDLQAVWCHWCHVMDVETYEDPRVIALVQSQYIAVKVDQDAHPDLASRYQDYGWPATVVFNAEGGEIVKRQGFLPPEQMASILKAIIDDPSPGPSVTLDKPVPIPSQPGLVDAATLRQKFVAGYDWKLGGWGARQKFMNWDNVEFCLVRAQSGDVEAEKMARSTLNAQRQLIDPVWGGVNQYSAEGDWLHPHFEKIMQFQAENMRIYAEAFTRWKEPTYLEAAKGIHGYVRKFLTSPEGVVYASQDADLKPGEHAADYFKLNDAERRKLGVPHVDQHIYARENGWFIEALAALYGATGDARYLQEAESAERWVSRNRSTEGGGFRHGAERTDTISLADNLAMGRAFLALYGVTADRAWLNRAERTAGFIAGHFGNKVDGRAVGFNATSGGSALIAPVPDFDENVSLARFANLLFRYTWNPRDKETAAMALRFPGAPEIAKTRLSSVGGLLLAEEELAGEPLHVAVVGGNSDPVAKELFLAATSFPRFYKQVEWVEGGEVKKGPDAISYPKMSKAAAYFCANGTCSAPIFEPAKLRETMRAKVGTPQ